MPGQKFCLAYGGFDLAFRLWPVGTTDTRYESVVSGELQELFVESQLAGDLFDQHRLHAIREDAFGDAAEVVEGMHHAVQQVMDVLALRELEVAHARVRQREREAVETATIPVAEMAPVHLALLAWAGFEAHEGAFASFLAPRSHLGKFQPAKVGNFQPALLRNFQSTILGNIRPA